MEGSISLREQVLFLLRGRENFTYWTPQTSKGLGIKESLFDWNKFWFEAVKTEPRISRLQVSLAHLPAARPRLRPTPASATDAFKFLQSFTLLWTRLLGAVQSL